MSKQETYVVVRATDGRWFAYFLPVYLKKGNNPRQHAVFGTGDCSVEALGDLLERVAPKPKKNKVEDAVS